MIKLNVSYEKDESRCICVIWMNEYEKGKLKYLPYFRGCSWEHNSEYNQDYWWRRRIVSELQQNHQQPGPLAWIQQNLHKFLYHWNPHTTPSLRSLFLNFCSLNSKVSAFEENSIELSSRKALKNGF